MYIYVVCRCVFEIDVVLYKQLQNRVALCKMLTNGSVQFVISISKSCGLIDIDFTLSVCNYLSSNCNYGTTF